MRARDLVLLMLLACSKSADPPPQPPPSPAADARGSAADAAAPADAEAPPKWGASVPDPNAERQAMELFAAVAGGKAKPDAVLAPVLIIGPGLWQLLSRSDAAIAKLGTPSQAMVPTGSAPQLLDMRSFIEPTDRKAVVTNPALVGVARLMMQGKPRAATDAERRLFYALSPLEIAGHPMTVIDTDRLDILVFAEDGKLAWIDAPGAYSNRPQPAQPGRAR
jgi:hypothetical protein